MEFEKHLSIVLSPHVRSATDTRGIFICKERHKRSKIIFKLLVDLFLRNGGICPAFGVNVSNVVLL